MLQFAGIWRACGRQGLPPLLDPWPGQNTIAPRALYSPELRLLAHVSATARVGDPASVCKAIEDFGEEVLDLSGLWLNLTAPPFHRPLRKLARKTFRNHFFRSRVARKTFRNDRARRCDEFWLIFVEIGAILAIFRPFEVFRAV